MIKAALVTSKNYLLIFLFIGIFTIGWTGTVRAELTNLALTGTASQSSTGYWNWWATADRAIDGNTDGNYFNGSVSHTDSETGAWWKVDLGKLSNIDKIVIWNRTDNSCGARLDNFYVSILNETGTKTLWTSTHNSTFPLNMTFDPTNIIQGRYVEVGLHGTNFLQLAEVQVYGSSVPIPSALFLLAPGLLGLAGLKRKYLG
jgi:hypothetical protein